MLGNYLAWWLNEEKERTFQLTLIHGMISLYFWSTMNLTGVAFIFVISPRRLAICMSIKVSSTVYSQPTYPEHVFYSWIASGFWNCSIYRGIHQNIQSIGSWLISITSVVKRKKLSSSKFDYLTRKNFWANLWPSPGRHRKFGIIGFHTRFCAESKYRFSSRKL